MNGVWRSLLWKEWREQRWKALCLLIASTPALATPYIGESDTTAALIACLAFLVLAACLFLGAGAAASEQSQRTMGFLQSLPASTKWTAIVKLGSALLLLWLPFAVFFVADQLWKGTAGYTAPRISPVTVGAIAGLALSSFVIWVAAVGVNLSDEVRAGAVGFLTIICCWALAAWLIQLEPRRQSMLDRGITGLVPGGVWYLALQIDEQIPKYPQAAALDWGKIWPLVVGAVLSNAAVAAAYIWRFGRIAPRQRQPSDSAAKSLAPAWLAPPIRWPWTAILWKQCCESLPLALLGAGSIFCFSMFVAATAREGRAGWFSDGLLPTSIPIWIMIGALVSIVSGIGLWLDDLRPELHAFWRSRPIAIGQWFALKFAASAVITIATLTLPSLFIYCGVALMGNRPLQYLLGGDDWRGPISLALLSQFGCFCVAAAFMAATRRPMVSALLTILVAACVALCVVVPFSLEMTGSAVVIAAISALATAAGWLCIRNDWSWGT